MESPSDKPEIPQKPATAFFLFKADRLEEVQSQNPEASSPQIIKIISEQWNSSTEQERQKYEQQELEAQKKYEKEMKAHEVKYGKAKNKKRRPVPNPPKKPKRAFKMFEDDIEDNCLIENEWDRESTDRNKYEKKYQEAKIDYEKRLKAYEEKYGKVSEGENFEDDPKLPREPKTAYEMFTDDFYKQKMLIKIWNREDYTTFVMNT